MPERIKFDISTTSIIKVILAVLAVWFLFVLRDIFVLFFLVLVLVAALSPLVDWAAKYIPRALAVVILAVLVLGVFTAIGFLIIPVLISELKLLAVNLPVIATKFGPIYDQIQHSLLNYQEGLFNLTSQIGKISTNIYSTTVGFISGVFAFFTILVLSFYMLLEKNYLKNALGHFILPEKKERVLAIVDKLNHQMGKWLGGHFLLMIAIGILDSVVLTALGVPYALILAIWGGLVEIIPYLGPWLSIIPAFIIAYTVSPLTGLLIIIAYVIIQQLESIFLAPKILGKAVGLSPIIIILALLAGGKLAGLLGVIVAVPAAAVISVLVQEWPEIKKLRERS
jgi:predicted PurR-regulated permease PerM